MLVPSIILSEPVPVFTTKLPLPIKVIWERITEESLSPNCKVPLLLSVPMETGVVGRIMSLRAKCRVP